MKFFLYITLSVVLCCTACAPRQSNRDVQTSDQNPAALSPDGAMAHFIGTGLEGDTSTFANTHLGSTVTVTVGHSYVSALGQLCKRAYSHDGGMRRSLAACKEEEGAWTLAPDIFEYGAF
ncbi:MAG: hypothetical protein IJU37_12940 [Desulfovibrio sp.]|nr:hypothetical protein [Desulfovibrio sp.]